MAAGLFAVGLFLLLVCITALMITFAGKALLVDRGVPADLQSIIENFVLGVGDKRQPARLVDEYAGTREDMLTRVATGPASPTSLALFIGCGYGFVVGAFLTVVLLFYFLGADGKLARGSSDRAAASPPVGRARLDAARSILIAISSAYLWSSSTRPSLPMSA